jgi:TRAP transporter TAXI family solute receptor
MKQLFLACILLLGLNAAFSKPLYTIFTGIKKGTYYEVAEDIQKSCPQFEINIESTIGSLQNINSLITAPVIKNGYRFALVQEDALNAVIGSEERAKEVYKIVSYLYKEEIVIITSRKSNIKSVSDLSGKKVAGGLPGSGIWFTSNKLRTSLNLKWINIDKSPEESILSVLTGEVDAMIMVGGSPVRLFEELGKPLSQYIVAIPLINPILNTMYEPAQINKGTYPWQDYPIETKAVKSIMIAGADVPDNAIKELKECLTQNQTAIQKFGHQKWKEILPLKADQKASQEK